MTSAAKIGLIVVLAVYGFITFNDPSHYRLLDNVDLAIHEAGHIFFAPFGEFVASLGGTLFQLIVPLTFFGYFARQRNWYAAAVLLWWVGQNLWNVSVYIKDARSLELPLVGGGEHDWAYMLGELGLLHRDQEIGQIVFLIGVLFYAISIMWGFMTARSQPSDSESGLTTVLLLVVALPYLTACDSSRQTSDMSSIDSLLWREITVAEDMRAETPEELAPLFQGLRSTDPLLRQIAVRALGRLERPELVESITRMLADSAAMVRAEAANALGQSVSRESAELALPPLVDRYDSEPDPLVRGIILQTLGRLRLAQTDELSAVEEALIAAADGAEPSTLVGIARGIESFVRQRPRGTEVSEELMATLRSLSQYQGQSSDESTAQAAQVRRLATTALVRSGRATFLPEAALSDPDADVRRIAIGAVAIIDSPEDRAEVIRQYLVDPAAVVRYAALQAYGRYQLPLGGCDIPFEALHDPDPNVGLLAIDLLGRGCADDQSVIEVLLAIADSLQEQETWHRSAHALVSLARTAQVPTELLLPQFAGHNSWWVRMYAARAAGLSGSMEYLERLAGDDNDNVRHAAITAISDLAQHDADAIYIAQLMRPDYQLVMTAAQLLEGSHDAERAVPALLGALALITADQRETSRDVRRAILRRLEELGGADQAEELRPYLADFDPMVAEDAARILTAWTGVEQVSQPSAPPVTPVPSLNEIAELANARPVLEMEGGGRIELELLAFEAPTNAARFARLARSGYFNGLTFHRIVPGFVVQGGSPGANEFMGDGPYTRDELILDSHLRGTVGVSTRGRDTGDGQIFVNLVDNPRLDHNYTIFARVVSGMDVIDRMLEGAAIRRISWH
ncbi:MAG: HEAT repeat domain-containing protein [Gemmatimonadota bacterium]|nr:MAG: HEAT repeat domain-containing protein [Gemmatimonadota bacterium]